MSEHSKPRSVSILPRNPPTLSQQDSHTPPGRTQTRPENHTMGNQCFSRSRNAQTQSSNLGRTVAARTQVVETSQLRPRTSSLPSRVQVMSKTPAGGELEPLLDRDPVKGVVVAAAAPAAEPASSIFTGDETGLYDPEVNGILVIAGDASRFETGADEAPDAQPAAPHADAAAAAAATENQQQEEQPEQQAQQQEKKGDDRVSESHTVLHDPATGSPGVHIKLEYDSITIAGENNVVLGFSSDFLAQAQKHPTGVTFEVKCGPINVAASSRNIKVGHCIN
ncbi:hypothetical protein RB595_000423 [Gaeumannomyces hyphopodioides]